MDNGEHRDTDQPVNRAGSLPTDAGENACPPPPGSASLPGGEDAPERRTGFDLATLAGERVMGAQGSVEHDRVSAAIAGQLAADFGSGGALHDSGIGKAVRDAQARVSAFAEGRSAASPFGAIEQAIRASRAMSFDKSALLAAVEAKSAFSAVHDLMFKQTAFVDQLQWTRKIHEAAAFARPAGLEMAAMASVMPAIDTLKSQLAAITRTERWALGVASTSLIDNAIFNAPRSILASEFTAVSFAANGVLADIVKPFASLSPGLERLFNVHHELAGTALKMSAFAGALDVVGPGAASAAAFDSLFGRWRTDDALPAAYWQRPKERARYYREADVDPGLIQSDTGALVEMLVETGVAEGEHRDGRTTAILDVGPVRVKVTAARPREGAYRLLGAFEIRLRAFVAARLRQAAEQGGQNPDKWFEQRMPGDIVKRARERRREAQLAGEVPAPPIDFVDLGDFMTIMTTRTNWPVFEDIFESQEALRVDIGRLNWLRRPVAHLRKVDQVQLAEATFTVNRLISMIVLGGVSDPGWDEDD